MSTMYNIPNEYLFDVDYMTILIKDYNCMVTAYDTIARRSYTVDYTSAMDYQLSAVKQIRKIPLQTPFINVR